MLRSCNTAFGKCKGKKHARTPHFVASISLTYKAVLPILPLSKSCLIQYDDKFVNLGAP